MLVEVKTLTVTGFGSPTVEELNYAQFIANRDNCAIRLIFRRNLCSPIKEVLVEKDTDIQLLHEVIENQLMKI